MLRLLRPDLLFGLGGFALGAVALLLIHPTPPGPAPAPRTDMLSLVASAPSSHHARPNAG